MHERLAHLLTASQIQTELKSREQNDAIREVAAVIEHHPAVLDLNRFVAAVLEREKLASTCVGAGTAFPHARTAAVKDLVIAVGRSSAGISCGASKVHLFVLIGVSPTMVTEYLQLVRHLTRVLKTPSRFEAILRAESPEVLAALLRES